jgi:hypothetical protein
MITRHRESLFACVAALAVKAHWSEEAINALPLRRLYGYMELMYGA